MNKLFEVFPQELKQLMVENKLATMKAKKEKSNIDSDFAFERAKISKLPAEVQAAYEAEDEEYDRYSQHTADQINKGKEEGLQEGKLEGQREKQLEIARNMLSLDIEIEKIAKATNLSLEKIASLKPTI